MNTLNLKFNKIKEIFMSKYVENIYNKYLKFDWTKKF